MFAAPAPVEQTTHARLIVSTHRSALLRVTLRYRPDDPLAVRMLFPAEFALETGDPALLPDSPDPAAGRLPDAAPPVPEIEWVFARQLLSAGLELPSGEGDVHIRPALGGRTMVELRSPDGVALLQFDRIELRRFLWSTLLAVPEGQELHHLDCDAALAQLLA
ncbi:SsgA family sporulation/cell division regulator [Streptomyces sp. TLI_171]|uniref:SsgA family sporulation/cell division regulator n=1 Tax=Streptomyces sp. TLI_171 TaxID=1938859 RepID=UPI000C182CAC|nr:SsgA family sporulation/cell division regulator [Streptomyces sp. TLI_171]RKE19279.1 sporulation and cell division protein SsgA [Streptomyces sp. TLI_171]